VKAVRPDRLRDVVDAVIEALDEGLDGRALAARAMLSPFHFNRLVRAGIGEAPAAFRRRLLLERAAWQLARGASVISASVEAGYDAVEAFSRAFARAHGVPPSRFGDARRDFRIVAPNGIPSTPRAACCCRAKRGAPPWISPIVSSSTTTGTRRASWSRLRPSPTTPSTDP
jgi:AraC-like DNA-binding protein